MTRLEFKEYLMSEGLTRSEIADIFNKYCLNDISFINDSKFKIIHIYDLATLGADYLKTATNNTKLPESANFYEFGKYVVDNYKDIYCLCESSNRVIEWKH